MYRVILHMASANEEQIRAFPDITNVVEKEDDAHISPGHEWSSWPTLDGQVKNLLHLETLCISACPRWRLTSSP